VFKHAGTKARLFLPWRRETMNVDAARLNGIYQLVQETGVANRQTIDAALATAAGSTRKKHHAGSRKPLNGTAVKFKKYPSLSSKSARKSASKAPA
jgi:hypothetical protein